VSELLAGAITAVYAALLVSFVLAFVRLVLGPMLADRVVALDLIAFLSIGLIAVYTIDTGVIAWLDIAITLALVAFLGTIAFARFILRVRERRETEAD
jgi:multicomponent Na+:H+ antiporter subunit F